MYVKRTFWANGLGGVSREHVNQCPVSRDCRLEIGGVDKPYRAARLNQTGDTFNCTSLMDRDVFGADKVTELIG